MTRILQSILLIMAIAMSKSRKEINRDYYEKHGLEYHREYREKKGIQVLCANCNTKKQIELCRKERLKNPVYKERLECDVDDTAAA